MSVDTACQITNGRLLTPRLGRRRFRGVSVDTRTLRPGSAFFCLRGEHADGHRFAARAGELRAGLIVAEHGRATRWRGWSIPVIGVDDPLTALGDLAAEFCRCFPTRYIAVTGSVGKTTTKEMIADALSARFRTYRSPGNYNNLIGIPLALLARNLRAARQPRYGVLEFGMSTPGEIARLTRIVAPAWGVVTRIAPSHMLQMKTMGAVARAKRELFDHAPPGMVAFLNADDPRQRRWMRDWDRDTVTYGLGANSDVTGDRIETDPNGRVSFRVNNRHPMRIAYPGEHNVSNALAAVAVARRLGVSFARIAERLEKSRPVGHRSRVVRLGPVTLIEDCYNANPASMQAALKALGAWPAERRIAVLGVMRELGEREIQWHRDIGQAAARHSDLLVAVGDLAGEYTRGARTGRHQTEIIICRTRRNAMRVLERTIQPGDVILLKASHSERFEDIAAHIRRSWPERRSAAHSPGRRSGFAQAD